MRNVLSLLFTLSLILVLSAGCASFTTTQSDLSYDNQGQPQRTITTQVKASTFFNAKSSLGKSKVLQTEKTQSSMIGELNLAATNNVIEALKEINQILEKVPK